MFSKARIPVLVALLVVISIFLYTYLPLPSSQDDSLTPYAEPGWTESGRIEDNLWGVFQPQDGSNQGAAGALSQRFRLAGTFFAYISASGHTQKAILDDLVAKTQHLVVEGDVLGDVTVSAIFHDHIVLRSRNQEETLWLSFKGSEGAAKDDESTAVTVTARTQQVLEESIYGKRVGEKRWVLKRQALLDYYQELLDDPERITNLYASLMPDYDKGGKILGYIYKPEGEEEFFRSMGVKEGDKIRKVNSMIMKSQSRAEYFIGEFMKSRLNAVVIDIERNGTEDKLIYLIR